MFFLHYSFVIYEQQRKKKAGSPIYLKELYAVIKELTHDYDIRNLSEYTFIFCSVLLAHHNNSRLDCEKYTSMIIKT